MPSFICRIGKTLYKIKTRGNPGVNLDIAFANAMASVTGSSVRVPKVRTVRAPKIRPVRVPKAHPVKTQKPGGGSNTLKVGMPVIFGRTYGEKTRGVIVKINERKVKVRTLEARGRLNAGKTWNVPPHLITVLNESSQATELSQGRNEDWERPTTRRQRQRHWFEVRKAQYGVNSRQTLAQAILKDPKAPPNEQRWAYAISENEKLEAKYPSRVTQLRQMIQQTQQEIKQTSDPAVIAQKKKLIEEIKSALWEYRAEMRHG